MDGSVIAQDKVRLSRASTSTCALAPLTFCKDMRGALLLYYSFRALSAVLRGQGVPARDRRAPRALLERARRLPLERRFQGACEPPEHVSGARAA